MESPQGSRSALSVLIVEDDELAKNIICHLIAKKFPGSTINLAENGEMGVQLSREHAPDLVITDINMPKLDGIQMASEIKMIKDDVKFIVLTGYSDTYCQEKLSEIGITDLIVKPVRFGALLALVEKCIGEITLGI